MVTFCFRRLCSACRLAMLFHWILQGTEAMTADHSIKRSTTRRQIIRTVANKVCGGFLCGSLIVGTGGPASSSEVVTSTPQAVPSPPSIVVPTTGIGTPKLRPVVIGNINEEKNWPKPNQIETNLGKFRILAQELGSFQQSPFFAADQELYYPTFLFGSWDVKATLKRKVYPYGPEFLPSSSLFEGSPRNREEKVGSTTNYEVHYFSTLADTLQNKLTVQLGTGIPQSRIIADRAYNAISISKAYQQFSTVESVDWDPSKDPTRLKLQLSSMTDDLRPLGPRRAEVYLTARAKEESADDVFACTERSRTVTLATRDVIVSDLESITEFHRVDPNLVTAINRIAVFLTPNPNSREGALWQQVGGKAVAFFDYDLEMKRITEPFKVQRETGDTTVIQERACVKTPKDVIQCE